MTLKEISRYSELRERLWRAEELLRSFQEAIRPGSPSMSGMPSTPGIKDKVGDLAVEIADLSERIKYLKEEIRQEEQRIKELIESVNDERLRMIFRLKFLRGLTWMQTAETMGEKYTEEGVRKMCYRHLGDE